MRNFTVKLITILFLSSFLCIPMAYSRDTNDKNFQTYDVSIISRIFKAIEILKIEGIDVKDYKTILYSVKEKHYIITFDNGVYFAEDGPIKSPTLEMFFLIKSESLVGIRGHE